jgi:hypothetical protein
MAKARRKAAKRAPKRRKAKTVKMKTARKRKPARRSKAKRQGLLANVGDAIQETGALRRRLAGHETFED